MSWRFRLACCSVVLLSAVAASAVTPTQRCVAGKDKAAGKYAACIQKAEARLATNGDAGRYSVALGKCAIKFHTTLDKLDAAAQAAGASCPGVVGPLVDNPGSPFRWIPRILAAGSSRFVDNGDGTVVDSSTGLQWEKKDDLDGSTNYANPHDADNDYTWSVATADADGSAFTDQLAKLNQSGACFAGQCDWRLPTHAELQTILVEPHPCGVLPCIDPVFGPTQFAGGYYWSSTEEQIGSGGVWVVAFSDGAAGLTIPASSSGIYVRAVRGGY